MIRVHIVDDHKMFVEGLSRVINESGKAETTAIYHDLKTCRAGLSTLLPDVLLLDISLPDGNGMDFCDEIKKLYPELKILILTSLNEISIAKRSIHNGALGYVLKNGVTQEVITGIERVYNGETFLCDDISRLMRKKKEDEVIWLTPREKEVLLFIAEGYSNPEIAEKMFLSKETIKGYRRDLLVKFKAKNSVALVRIAMQMKLI